MLTIKRMFAPVVFIITCSIPCIAQRSIDTIALSSKMYCSNAAGLSVRVQPDLKAAVMSKILYGAVVTPVKTAPDSVAEPAHPIALDGMNTSWTKVAAAGKTGYVVDAYLSDYAPPKPGTADLKTWATAMAKPYGQPFYGRSPVYSLQEDGIDIFRQLYANGAVYSEGQGYEYFYSSLQLPGTSILKVYNAVKGLKDFEAVFKANTGLRNGKYHIAGKDADDGYDWEVAYSNEGNYSWLKSITISWSQGASSTLRIQEMETEVLIIYSSGV